MKEIICFFKDKNVGPLHFVSSYERKRLFRRERISYSLEKSDARYFDESEGATIESVRVCVQSDFPDCRMFTLDDNTFERFFQAKRFWGICKINEKDGRSLWYAGIKGRTAVWSLDVTNALLCLDLDTEIDTLNVLRQGGGRLNIKTVHLNLTNELLAPKFILTCTSKGGDKKTMFFAGEEGGSLRLANDSFSACKLTYRESVGMFERLRVCNKDFSYAVIPDFEDNVNCSDLDEYSANGKINRMVQMELKLRNVQLQ